MSSIDVFAFLYTECGIRYTSTTATLLALASASREPRESTGIRSDPGAGYDRPNRVSYIHPRHIFLDVFKLFTCKTSLSLPCFSPFIGFRYRYHVPVGGTGTTGTKVSRVLGTVLSILVPTSISCNKDEPVKLIQTET